MTNIKTLQFEEFIEAPVETVWNAFIDKETYESWTSVFSEGSTFEGSWDEGSEIRFIDPAGGGMIARVAENRPHEFISLAHHSFIENGEVKDQTEEWGGPAYENYTFESVEDGTKIIVHQDIIEEYEEMFLDLWPKALAKLKEVCEEK